jgi:uncharacterized protein YdaU (DUF1376 family)
MSERGSAWYKRDPIAFLDGVEGMGPELIGAYAYVLDLIYARNGRSRRDDAALAGRMGCSKRKARALVDALIKRGKIEVHGDYLTHKRAQDHANTTRKVSEQRANSGRKGGEKRPVDKKNKHLGKASASDENKQIREDKNITPLYPPRGDDRFDDFWPMYPRKVGKDAARKAWAKAVKRSSADEILAGLKLQLPALAAKEQRFQPHPATWLNEGRWQDEPGAHKSPPMDITEQWLRS